MQQHAGVGCVVCVQCGAFLLNWHRLWHKFWPGIAPPTSGAICYAVLFYYSVTSGICNFPYMNGMATPTSTYYRQHLNLEEGTFIFFGNVRRILAVCGSDKI